ncbi:hypothetical protein ACFSCV_17190 [Methylopila henanensis]|uniref:Anti-sigma factor NepR domain-containing protein n=1 Tax=Methylopila henanensis TaxID=873516 RepID=A0ABW4K991_9HYPH
MLDLHVQREIGDRLRKSLPQQTGQELPGKLASLLDDLRRMERPRDRQR